MPVGHYSCSIPLNNFIILNYFICWNCNVPMCQKCAKTHLCARAISKIFPVVIPPRIPLLKQGEGRERKGRGSERGRPPNIFLWLHPCREQNIGTCRQYITLNEMCECYLPSTTYFTAKFILYYSAFVLCVVNVVYRLDICS